MLPRWCASLLLTLCAVRLLPKLPARSVVREAVVARSARLADGAHEPFVCYIVGVVNVYIGFLFLLYVFLALRSNVLEHIMCVILALAVVVKADLLEVRGLGDRLVGPLPSDVRELLVEDRHALFDAASLKGVAGPAVVV